MKDSDCVAFLQWALPRLRLRWPGFRKVRRQVCKRVDRRLRELSLSNVGEYRSYLDTHLEEWPALDALCRIFISRFYRDKAVFQYLEREVLPRLAQVAIAGGEADVRCWCIGCASGEEPYTLAILWRLALGSVFPTLGFRILATDVDRQAIERAQRGGYPASSIRDLPDEFRAQAFVLSAGEFFVKAEYREPVTFLEQDVRTAAPEGSFHVILCRNVAFTYFDEALQREILQKITNRLVPGGALVLGNREALPTGCSDLTPWDARSAVYRKLGSSHGRGS